MDTDSDDNNNGSGSEASHSGSGSESEASLHNESSSSSDDDDSVEQFNVNLQRVRENEFNVNLQRVKVNDPEATELAGNGRYNCIEHMTDEGWDSSGALSDSPIEDLRVSNCSIESIALASGRLPRNLKHLHLDGNNIKINADGRNGLAKLLQGGHSTLKGLWLSNNMIDNEGVAILVDILRSNTTLTTLALEHNNDITYDGEMLLLKLVNNLSSIKATLQSNHTLTNLTMKEINPYGEYPYQNDLSEEFQMNINVATQINANEGNLVAAGREKVVVSHLDSQIRLALYCLQDLDDSLYSQIDPLHLPEIFSLIWHRHGHEELFVALSSSIMSLFSTVDRKKCIRQQREYHAAHVAEHRAKMEELDAELAAEEREEVLEEEIAYHTAKLENLQAVLAEVKRTKGDEMGVGSGPHSNKRRRN
eukprot:scaffold44506_cov131-Skeletonema_marinoi.AAC.2